MPVLPYIALLLWLVFVVLFYFFIIGAIQYINPDYVVGAIVGMFFLNIGMSIFALVRFLKNKPEPEPEFTKPLTSLLSHRLNPPSSE